MSFTSARKESTVLSSTAEFGANHIRDKTMQPQAPTWPAGFLGLIAVQKRIVLVVGGTLPVAAVSFGACVKQGRLRHETAGTPTRALDVKVAISGNWFIRSPKNSQVNVVQPINNVLYFAFCSCRPDILSGCVIKSHLLFSSPYFPPSMSPAGGR